MTQIPNPDLNDPKEVYAFVGLALYYANLVEASLVNLAVVLHMDQVKAITSEVFEDAFQKLEKKTLGQLMHAARSLAPIPITVDAVLAEALGKRNFLIHGLFRERAGDLENELGLRSVIEDVANMAELFQKADGLVTDIYMPLWEKYGVNEAAMEKEISAMRAEIESKYGGL